MAASTPGPEVVKTIAIVDQGPTREIPRPSNSPSDKQTQPTSEPHDGISAIRRYNPITQTWAEIKAKEPTITLLEGDIIQYNSGWNEYVMKNELGIFAKIPISNTEQIGVYIGENRKLKPGTGAERYTYDEKGVMYIRLVPDDTPPSVSENLALGREQVGQLFRGNPDADRNFTPVVGVGMGTAALGAGAWLASQRNGILMVTSVVFLVGLILFGIGLFNMTRNFLFAPRGGNVNNKPQPSPSPDPNNNIPTCKAVPCTPVPCQPVVNPTPTPTPTPTPQPQPVVNVQNNDVTMNQIRAMIENQLNQSGIPVNNANNQPLSMDQIRALIASELQRADSMGCDDPCGQNGENPSPTTNFS